MSIKKSIHPDAPYIESAQPTSEEIQVYGRRNNDGKHCESTSIEAPSSIQGELPTLNSEQQILISQISSSPTTLESISHHTLQSDGERLLAGLDLDDTITNTGLLSVFIKDPVINTNAPSCANQSSQTIRFEGSTPEGELSKSSPIQLEVPVPGTTPLKTLAEITLAVDARSTIARILS